MDIREATLGDIGLLTELNVRLRADEKIDNVMTDEQVRQRMIDRMSSTFKAYLFLEGETVYGYALVDHAKKPAYLCQIFIDRDFRSKGLGSEAFRLLLERTGISEMDVEVLTWNERAQKYYRNLGFYPRYIGLRYKKGG